MAAVRVAATEEGDDQLVERFRGGDRRAFDELVRRHQPTLLRLAQRFLRDAEEARDLAQRAFVQAFERLETFRGEASFRTWVYRITVNLALSQIRRRRRREEPPHGLAAEPAAEPSTSPADGETVMRLRRAVAELPHKQRVCVELRTFEELSFREVAAIVGCSEDAAKMNFHHAVKRLRERLAEDGK